MGERFPELSAFALAFAEQYREHMRSKKVTGAEIAEVLGRNAGYVSERVNGKRPLDTDDVDALAQLVGRTGRSLMIELAKNARETPRREAPPASLDEQRAKRVGGTPQTQRKVAKRRPKDPGTDPQSST